MEKNIMVIYGGYDERGDFERVAMERIKYGSYEEEHEKSTNNYARSRPGALESARAVLSGEGISYAGEESPRVLPHPMSDDHRNLPA